MTGRPVAIAALAFLDQRPQRLGARRPLDRNDAIAPRHPAEERDVGQLPLDHDDREVARSRTISSVSSIDWCLTAIRCGPGGISPSTLMRMPSTCVDQPMVELDPAQHHGQRRRGGPNRLATIPTSTHSDGRRIEDRRVEQRAQRGHRSAQTARRRSRYLLYSPNRVRKLGSVRTRVGDQRDICRPAPSRTRSARGACASRW